MKHIVKMSELEDYTFEQLICSDFPKKLVVFVNPSKGIMLFKLKLKDEQLGTYTSLDCALLDYNKL